MQRLLLLMMIFGSACGRCINPPLIDPTPPDAAFLIRYRDLGGTERSRTVSAGASDATIEASKAHPITVEYWGTDLEGVKKAELVYDMWYFSGIQRIQPLLTAIETESECAVATLLDYHLFDPEGTAWHYEFRTRATNAKSIVSISGKLKVEAK